MSSEFSEDTLVEQPAIGLLAGQIALRARTGLS
jgi:hypothetical protein